MWIVIASQVRGWPTGWASRAALTLALACGLAGATGSRCRAADAQRPPNFVLILCDDLGYADIGPFGAVGIATPNLDRMAAEGRRFTSFVVPQAVCSASRAGLLTGCYPNRVGILGALGPSSSIGLSDEEQTLAQLLKKRGYATGAYGKWHLGHLPPFLPLRHGFDDFFGLPYSNDMGPQHPEAPNRFPPLPLFAGGKVQELNPDQTQLTTRYTEHAVAFLEQNKDRPFFLYLAHSMPHVPLHVSDKFHGKSPRGLYGDVVMELDWSVGQVFAALRRLELDERTLVIFTSDNGPWLCFGEHAGSTGPLREGKGTCFEGGVRVPCIMRWLGKIPLDTTCGELASTIDLLPTLVRLAGGEVPKERVIDGVDIWPLLAGTPGATAPRDVFYYYWDNQLRAVRSGPWKLHFPHRYRSLADAGGTDGKPVRYVQREIGLALFNLDEDVGEAVDVSARYPAVVKRLEALAEKARDDLGDGATRRPGQNVRPAGTVRKAVKS